MFWKNFIHYCNLKNVKPNQVTRSIGMSNAAATDWKNGAVPRDTTLQKVADYFGITTEDLLREPTEKPSAPAETSPSLPPLAPEFYELLNQMTLQELAELKAHMEEKIKNRK